MRDAVGGMTLAADAAPCEGCGGPDGRPYRCWSADRVDFGLWWLCDGCCREVRG